MFDAGLDCVYEPSVRAWHHESVFRSRRDEKIERWTLESTRRLFAKWATADLTQWVPEAL